MKFSDACTIFFIVVVATLLGFFPYGNLSSLPYFLDWIYFEFLTVFVAYFHFNPSRQPLYYLGRFFRFFFGRVCRFCKALPRCWADSRTQTNPERRLK